MHAYKRPLGRSIAIGCILFTLILYAVARIPVKIVLTCVRYAS